MKMLYSLENSLPALLWMQWELEYDQIAQQQQVEVNFVKSHFNNPLEARNLLFGLGLCDAVA